MSSLEKPCLLLPHGSARSSVYVCVPVDPELATKSAVLETLMDFNGVAELPDAVSLSDFKRWSDIATLEPSALDLEQLSFALQVGDRLSAHNTVEVAAALAAKLATSWSSSIQHEAALSTLLSLDQNLRQLVFSNLGNLQRQDLLTWPTALQQAYTDTWVSRPHGERSFTIDSELPLEHNLKLLGLLARTDPSLPRLNSLIVQCNLPTPEAASALCAALIHHSTLERLSMPLLSWARHGPPPPAATAHRMLPQLTTITCLTLSAPCQPASPSSSVAEATQEGVLSMASAISSLPCLATFRLHTVPSPCNDQLQTPAPLPKRRKIAAYMGQCGAAIPSLDPVIAALSTAPSLTRLCFNLPASTSGQPLACSGIRGPFCKLARLRYEVCIDDEDHLGRHGARVGHAPATGLLDSDALPALLRIEYYNQLFGSKNDMASVRRVLASAARQPDLEGVDIRLSPESYDRDACGFMIAVEGDASPGTVEVNVHECIPRALSQALLDCLPGITAAHSVQLHLGNPANHLLLLLLQGLENTLPMAQVLNAMTGLQSFSCSIKLEAEDSRELDTLYGGFVGGPLWAFKQLTYLRLDISAPPDLPLFLLSAQLTTMPQLQRLLVGDIEVSEALEFEECFATLSGLTHFEVTIRPFDRAVVQSFGRVVSGMPLMEYAGLYSCDGPDFNPSAVEERFASVDWFQGLLHLPSRGRYRIGCCIDSIGMRGMTAVKEQLERRGAKVSEKLDLVNFEDGLTVSLDVE